MRTRHEAGLSLIELMIAITLGLLILAGLTTVFVSASESQRELQRSAQQIENGRYGMDALTQDLHHAGFYGSYSAYTDGTTIPDPCITGDETALTAALGDPVQGFIAASQTALPSLAGTTCATYLPNANLHPGSDILVIRRAETTPLRYPGDGLSPVVTAASPALASEVYLQADPVTIDIQFGNGASITSSTKASGGAASILQKNGNAAPIRKYHIHIYFVAPCSVPAGGASVCTGSADDSGSPIPTLKRLELSAPSGTRTFNTVPIAEGIEALKIEYGVDNSPSTVDANTGRIGDGAPDLCIPNSVTSTPTAADWPNVVSAKVWLVARSPQSTPNHSDTKTYGVATASTSYCSGANPGTPAGSGLAYGPYNDAYKRHSFFSDIRLVNLSSRREIPP
jgi:type IV pilus assembly protein PilW